MQISLYHRNHFGMYRRESLRCILLYSCVCMMTADCSMVVTEPLDSNDASCQDPVFMEDEQANFLDSQTNALWTNVRKHQIPSHTWISQKGTVNISNRATGDCSCGFLEAKGFPSTLSESISFNTCYQRYGYVCQREECSECNESDCLRDEETCFHVHCSESDWEGARKRCLSRSADLAVIRSNNVKKLLEKKAFALCQKFMRKFWVGKANCFWLQKDQGSYFVVPSKLWLPGQPTGEENCAVRCRADDIVGLRAQPCDSKHPFLCKMGNYVPNMCMATGCSNPENKTGASQFQETNIGSFLAPSLDLRVSLSTAFVVIVMPNLLTNHPPATWDFINLLI